MKKIEYIYLVQDISEGKKRSYKAYIPAFNAIVYGDSLENLEDGISFSINDEIKHRKKNQIPIPKPDEIPNLSGKFTLRIDPELHQKLFLAAKAKNTSLNNFIENKLATNS